VSYRLWTVWFQNAVIAVLRELICGYLGGMLFPMITEEMIKKVTGQYDCKAIQRLRLERKGKP
jgi:hypothetical protein